MVGEIRDSETATTAINAALTGHLVLSTLHTNNAAGSFPRLLDLGVNSKVISSAINIAIAQRLVRTLCDKCKKEVPLEGKNKETVEKNSLRRGQPGISRRHPERQDLASRRVRGLRRPRLQG